MKITESIASFSILNRGKEYSKVSQEVINTTKSKLRTMTKPLKTIMVKERSQNMDLLSEDVGANFKLSMGAKKVVSVSKHWDKNPHSLQNRRDPNKKNLRRQDHIDDMKTSKKPKTESWNKTQEKDNINQIKKITKVKVDVKFKVNK